MRGGCENEVRDNELGKEYRVEIWQEWSLIIEYWWLVWYIIVKYSGGINYIWSYWIKCFSMQML